MSRRGEGPAANVARRSSPSRAPSDRSPSTTPAIPTRYARSTTHGAIP